jgi:hypothetical protein
MVVIEHVGSSVSTVYISSYKNYLHGGHIHFISGITYITEDHYHYMNDRTTVD